MRIVEKTGISCDVNVVLRRTNCIGKDAMQSGGGTQGKDGGEPMKITMTEKITTIEADARELRESNTLASNLSMMLSRCFRSNEPFEDDEDEGEDEGEGGQE